MPKLPATEQQEDVTTEEPGEERAGGSLAADLLAAAANACPPEVSADGAPSTVHGLAIARQRKIVDAAMLRLMNQDHSEFLLEEYERERETLRKLTEQLAAIVAARRG